MKRSVLALFTILLVASLAVITVTVHQRSLASSSGYCWDDCPWPMWHPWYWMLCDQPCEPIITQNNTVTCSGR